MSSNKYLPGIEPGTSAQLLKLLTNTPSGRTVDINYLSRIGFITAASQAACFLHVM